MPEYPYAEDKLERWTKQYWQRPAAERWDYYLGPVSGGIGNPPKPLLYIEMECAERAGRPVCGISTTLALLVGTSFEPLLQAVYAYHPDRLVPIVNHFYGDRQVDSQYHRSGQRQWDDLRRLIERLQFNGLSMPSNVQTVSDTPGDVFNYLRVHLQNDLIEPDRLVVIDITGAKKTMVAGAYLFAAYYVRPHISYVDFDRWEEGEGKPYGYTCRISDQINNPMREWALREWDRVEEQYSNYNFAAALTAIPLIEASAYNKAVSYLQVYMEVCDAWSTGNLHAAKAQMENLPDELKKVVPLAVKEVGSLWPDLTQLDKRLSIQFLLNPRALMIYAADEVAKAQRLVSRSTHPDYRGAFARAYAVYETLMKARVLILFNNGHLQCNIKDEATYASDVLPDEHKQCILNWMLDGMLTPAAKSIMGVHRDHTKITCTYKSQNSDKNVHVTIRSEGRSALHVEVPSTISKQDEDDLRKLRNLITHTYFPVTQASASRAIALAEAYRDEYQKNWGKEADPRYDPNDPKESFCAAQFEVPTWKTIKQVCGLDFLLP